MISRMISEALSGFRRERPPDPLGPAGGKSGIADAVRLVLPYARAHAGDGVTALTATLASIGLGYAVPFVTRSVVDDSISAGDTSMLPARLALLAGLGLLLLIAGALEQYATARFSGAATADMQGDLLGRAMSLPVRLFGEERTGYLMSRVTSDIQGVSWFLSGASVHLAASVVRLAAGVALMMSMEWRLGLLCLPFLAAMLLAAGAMSRRLRNLGLHSMEEGARVSRDLQEVLAAGTVVRAFAAEERMSGRVREGLGRMLGLMMERTASGTAAGLLLELVPGAARLCAAGAGAYLVIGGSMTLGSLLAFLSFLGSTLGPARRLSSFTTQIPQSLAAVDRVTALTAPPGEDCGSRRVDRLSGEVEFRDVSFGYLPDEPVLSGISFRIPPGGTMAVTGASGEGKTTLLMLLLGFYRPDSGSILIDGIPLDEYDRRSVRARMGFVPQEASVLSGTILENLRLGAPSATPEQALSACRDAGADFASTPSDLDRMLGEGGFGLSLGQRQRLAIARALVGAPDILLFDEPTSALDSSSEKALLSTLPRAIGARTAIMVTHSPAVLELSGSRLVIEGSRGEFILTGRACAPR